MEGFILRYFNRSLAAAVFFIILQQVLFATSTFFVARAGALVATGQAQVALTFVAFFLSTALAGYMLSSVSEALGEKAKNDILHAYYDKVVGMSRSGQISDVQALRPKFQNWMVGEAPTTIDEFVSFVVLSSSAVLNVALTLAVYTTVFSLEMTAIVFAALLMVVVLIAVIGRTASNLGNQLQEARLSNNQHVEYLWNSLFLMSRPLGELVRRRQFERLELFCRTRCQYKALEQSVALTPVVCCVVVLTIYIKNYQTWSNAEIGAAIALLPKTLQLFEYANALTTTSMKFFEVRRKMQNLTTFLRGSSDIDVSHHDWSDGLQLTNVSTGSTVDPNRFLKELKYGGLKTGRYLLTGDHGRGKSTFAKMAFLVGQRSVYLDRDTRFFEGPDENHSPGERFIANVRLALWEEPYVLVLDEWDTNLDEDTIIYLESLLDKFSQHSLLLEIRRTVKNLALVAK
ncbi:MAG: ABC transporter ATP-binding protein/permease [Shimia sp.]|uniref:hypothetical protein n=1 Tax=Shimia sp. TaxID=1954381 RepID=UPI003B8E2335